MNPPDLADSIDIQARVVGSEINSGVQRRGRIPEILGLVGNSHQKIRFNTLSFPPLNPHLKNGHDNSTPLRPECCGFQCPALRWHLRRSKMDRTDPPLEASQREEGSGP